MVILVNYKDSYDTTTTTANKSMGFDLSAIQSCIIQLTKADKRNTQTGKQTDIRIDKVTINYTNIFKQKHAFKPRVNHNNDRSILWSNRQTV